MQREGATPGEGAEARLKRMRMRSWRRGTKEMDLVLGPFADARLATMGPAELDAFDLILSENDQDLTAWIIGRAPQPDDLAPMLASIMAFANGRLSS